MISIVNYVTIRNKLVIDRIDIDSLHQRVLNVWLVKRGLYSGNVPIATDHLSHWGILTRTDSNEWFILAIGINHITEVKKALVKKCLVYTLVDKHPWYIIENYPPIDKSKTIKDYMEFITLSYSSNEYAFTGYNCHCAIVEALKVFSSKSPECIRGSELIKSVIDEVLHYKSNSLQSHSICIQ